MNTPAQKYANLIRGLEKYKAVAFAYWTLVVVVFIHAIQLFTDTQQGTFDRSIAVIAILLISKLFHLRFKMYKGQI